MELVALAGDYAYEEYKLAGAESVLIDAGDAHWIVSNIGANVNRYPFTVSDSANITSLGGSITGEVPLDMDWRDAYINSAAVFMDNTDNALIEDWRISQAWDGIRLRGAKDNVFTIDNVWLSDIRDDGVENDHGLSGTIRNSLFDGVFVAISTADNNSADQSQQILSIDHVLMRMKSFLYKGEVTHQSPFKVLPTSPGMKIHNSVIAVEDVNHKGQARLELAWDKTIEASGNYFLNLSDQPLPAGYPMPPAGFTVLQGPAARAFWQAASSEWISQRAEADGRDRPE